MNDRGSMTIRATVRAIALVAFAGLVALGCRPSQTVEQQTKDATLEAQVKARLAADVGAASVTAIEVNVTNGVVTLAGPVSTEEDRQRAEAAARSVEGVTSVNNNLQVTTTGVAAPPGTTYGTPPIAGTMPTTPLAVGATPPAQPPMAMTPEMAMPPPTEAVPLMTTPPASP